MLSRIGTTAGRRLRVARLVYSAITSLDGYVNDVDGGFDWAAPDEEVHRFVNDHERLIGTYLYGRRMYDVMRAWEDVRVEEPSYVRDYAQIWRSADKIVYSRTLASVTTARTTLAPRFEPQEVRRIVAAADRDVSVGGPTLAAHALEAGLVDELHLFVNPIVVGAGTPALPDRVLVPLELLDEHRVGNGVVHLHYGVLR
jgi:dihydrofolate reductase